MTDPMAILSEHVANTLPDSLSKRLAVLTALKDVMKSTHRAYRPVCQQISALQNVMTLQTELPLSFQPETK